MKKIKEFLTWFFDRLFDDDMNDLICYTVLVVVFLWVVFMAAVLFLR